MARIVTPEAWRAIGLIAAYQTTSELPPGGFPDDKLDALILAARAVEQDDGPIEIETASIDLANCEDLRVLGRGNGFWEVVFTSKGLPDERWKPGEIYSLPIETPSAATIACKYRGWVYSNETNSTVHTFERPS